MKAVMVLSGGQDSATSLAWAWAKGIQIQAAVHFDYGQRHAVERTCAEFWAKKYDLPLEVLPLPTFSAIGDSALVGGGQVADQHPTIKHLPASFVPGRNLVFLTLAAAYAMKVGAETVITGVCQTDYSGYPDCRHETIRALVTSVRLGMDFPTFDVLTPLMFLTKGETFGLASALGVLPAVVNETHTCYEGDRSKLHPWGYGCGRCGACNVRSAGWDEFERMVAHGAAAAPG